MGNAETANLTVVIALLIGTVAADAPAPAPTEYTNHTVGGSAGWFFDAATNKTSGDYSAWAAAQTFNLGDYLVFNTNSNQTVIQTFNKTTYKSCIVDDYTIQFYGGSELYDQPVTVSVPLTTVGPSYYFSSASDGEQCRHGLALEITVNHGLGLPPSLNQPPPPPYVEAPSPSADQSVPVTVLSNNKKSAGGARAGANLLWVAVFGGLVIM